MCACAVLPPRYSGRFAEPTDIRCFVSYPEWMDMLNDAGLLTGPVFLDRHAALVFQWSHMVVVRACVNRQPLLLPPPCWRAPHRGNAQVHEGSKDRNILSHNNSHMLTFVEFMEALCRYAGVAVVGCVQGTGFGARA